jgi:putative transcriptional regulator
MARFACLLLLLALALPSSGADAPPMKSIFLVAKKDLPDPNFSQTVVLVSNYGGASPMGVIINRPTEILLASALPDVERLRARKEKLFFGGPVKRNELVAVFRAPLPPQAGTAIEVLDGVYLSTSAKLLRELLGRDNPMEGLRIFAGYSGWGPGQLESEVARGSWHLVRADAKTIFEKKPEGMWQELERRASSIVALRSPETANPR